MLSIFNLTQDEEITAIVNYYLSATPPVMQLAQPDYYVHCSWPRTSYHLGTVTFTTHSTTASSLKLH